MIFGFELHVVCQYCYAGERIERFMKPKCNMKNEKCFSVHSECAQISIWKMFKWMHILVQSSCLIAKYTAFIHYMNLNWRETEQAHICRIPRTIIVEESGHAYIDAMATDEASTLLNWSKIIRKPTIFFKRNLHFINCPYNAFIRTYSNASVYS